MKTVNLSDDDFAEVLATMTAALDGQVVLIQVLAGRFGLESDEVAVERARLGRLEEASRSLRGVSGWRAGYLDKSPRH